MMFSTYLIGQLLGFFAVMIICDVLSIIFASKIVAWPIYGIGAGFTLFSMLGLGRSFLMVLMPGYNLVAWICYAILLFLGAFGIITRRRNKHLKDIESLCATESNRIECPLCGKRVASDLDTCPHCYSKLKG